MAKSRNTGKKPSVKVEDLRAKKNPRGGGSIATAVAKGKHFAKVVITPMAPSSNEPLTIPSADPLTHK